ncbi:UvrABC system protein C [bacterium BMS3Abin03]|nr:UvrABC system protein C [bacterium BMS3Abin03]
MPEEKLSNTSLNDTIFSVLDVETTGLSARNNRVIEIGLVKVKDFRIIDKFHTLINPQTYIPDFITQFTGITEDDVADSPLFSEVVDDVDNFIDGTILCGHNFSFDYSFLKSEFLRSGYEPPLNEQLCTLKLARRMYPDLKSKSLSSVTVHLRLKNKNSHRALSDAEVTARILMKMIKKLKGEEKIETTDDLLRFQKTSVSGAKSFAIKETLRDDVLSLPNAPGVYFFLNNKRKVIYVGKAKSLRSRIRTYFSSNAPRKAKQIIKQAKKLKIETTNSELTALLMEAEAIKLINPKHNLQLKKYGNKYFLKVTQTHLSPKIEISNHFDFDGNDYFGLFISRRKAETVLTIIDKAFALRECPDREYAKGKRCFLADIERCTAPCLTGNDKIYKDEVDKVYEFLFGQNQTALNRLLNKMKEFSNSEKYERAAEIKEVIDLILSQTHKTSLLAEPVNSANVLFEVSEGLGKDFILMTNGKIYVKKYALNKRDSFEDALDDFYSNTININMLPNEEDLEKMKITLNWLIKNRSKVRIFYLKDYTSKQELYARLSLSAFNNQRKEVASFDIKDLVMV